MATDRRAEPPRPDRRYRWWEIARDTGIMVVFVVLVELVIFALGWSQWLALPVGVGLFGAFSHLQRRRRNRQHESRHHSDPAEEPRARRWA